MRGQSTWPADGNPSGGGRHRLRHPCVLVETKSAAWRWRRSRGTDVSPASSDYSVLRRLRHEQTVSDRQPMPFLDALCVVRSALPKQPRPRSLRARFAISRCAWLTRLEPCFRALRHLAVDPCSAFRLDVFHRVDSRCAIARVSPPPSMRRPRSSRWSVVRSRPRVPSPASSCGPSASPGPVSHSPCAHALGSTVLSTVRAVLAHRVVHTRWGTTS